MMIQRKLFLLVVSALFVDGCEKLEFSILDIVSSAGLDIVSSAGVYDAPIVNSNDVLERAYQMATMEWEPLNPIPKSNGGFYEKGEKVKGAPYSSVKEISTYLFQDVSYHTFMTAIHNPSSVMYTENISKTPYHGGNCAPYYGSVCSSSVMWVLGIDIPYSTGQIIAQPFMEKIEYQVIDSLKVCDVLWKQGHVQMVYDIVHRADTLFSVSLFEQSGNSAHINSYTKDSFQRIWRKYEAYRYKYIYYSEKRSSYNGFPTIEYNDDLCPSKGDQAVYRTDESITINIFNPVLADIVLTKDGDIVSVDKYEGNNHQYINLTPGIYYAYLQADEQKSKPVSFEVVDVEVGFSFSDSETIVVSFSSTAKADFVVLCQRDGSSLLQFPISDEDRNRGYVVVPSWDFPEYYCKVVFRGKYGRIINNPLRVN